VQTLDDEDLRWRDDLRRVEQAGDVVVQGLIDGATLLDGPHLLVHEVEVSGPRVHRRDALRLPARAVQRVVVVEADHGDGVADERVGVRVPAPGRLRFAAEHAHQATQERALPAPGVGSQPDHHRPVRRRRAGHVPPASDKDGRACRREGRGANARVHGEGRRLVAVIRSRDKRYSGNWLWPWSCVVCLFLLPP
jgi:hypothetical protein